MILFCILSLKWHVRNVSMALGKSDNNYMDICSYSYEIVSM